MKKYTLLLTLTLASQSFAINPCDELAAERFNKDNPTDVKGVEFDAIEAELAIPACQKAVAEEPDSPRFQYQLGRAFNRNEDYENALIWYQKAIEKDYPPAQNNLGLLYEDGNAVEQSDELAEQWYRKAAEQGYAIAQFNLATVYLHNENMEKAFEWYSKAAAQGHEDAAEWAAHAKALME